MIVDKILGDLIGKVTGEVTGLVDELHLSGEERAAIEQKKEELKKNFALEMKRITLEAKEQELERYQAELADRQSARNMYSKKSTIQQIIAVLTTAAFFGIVAVLLVLIFRGLGVDIPQWQAVLVGSIFGAISQKFGTIIDFFFGGSDDTKHEERAAKEISENFGQGGG